MSKIIVEVEDKNLETILTILKSIKPELINTIQVDNTLVTKKAYKYIPKNNLEKKEVKNKPIIEDEFLANKPSGGKYISPSEFKNRLKK